MQDFQTVTMLIVFYYYYLDSNFLAVRKKVIPVGILFGIGLITKGNFFIFGIIPIIYSLVLSLKNKFFNFQLVNIFILFFISASIASIWFSINIYHFTYEFTNGGKEYGEKNFPPILSIESLSWYFKILGKYFGIFQSILLSFSILFLIINYKKLNLKIIFILISFLFYFIYITLFRVKDPRTFFPIIFFIVIIISYFLENINSKYYFLYLPIILLFIIQENFFYVTDRLIIFPKNVISEPFVTTAGFSLPNEDNNLAQFTYKMLQNQNSYKLTENNIIY
jgi:hypothetical protein